MDAQEASASAVAEATPTHVVEALLTLAVLHPTLGCRQLSDRLGDRGFVVSKTTVHKLLADHALSRRAQRVARAAAVAAAAGLITRPEQRDPIGFCRWAAGPRELVAMDGFFIGKLKGVGAAYELTAVDTATRLAMVWIIAGTPNGILAKTFLDEVVRWTRRHGHQVRDVLTDNGPEWVAAGLAQALAAREIRHLRIPPRSPNRNGLVRALGHPVHHRDPAVHGRSISPSPKISPALRRGLTPIVYQLALDLPPRASRVSRPHCRSVAASAVEVPS